MEVDIKDIAVVSPNSYLVKLEELIENKLLTDCEGIILDSLREERALYRHRLLSVQVMHKYVPAKISRHKYFSPHSCS